MTLTELRTKRAKAWESAKAFLDSHRTENGILTAEDDAIYTRMENEISDLGKEIARMERLEAMDKEMSRATSVPLTAKPEATKPTTKTGRASDEYNSAFWNITRSKHDTVLPEVRNALKVGVDTEGGYLVPDTFEKHLVQALDTENIVRGHAHVFTTSSGAHKIPVASSKGTASWVDEEGAIPESDDTFGQQLIGAHKVATIIKVSEELLNDSAFDLESYFAKEFARRIGNKEEAAFFTGDGVGKPLGLLATTGGAEVGVTAASATEITADEIIDLFYSLDAPYRKHAIWILNDATIAAVRKLKDDNGQYLWQKALHEGDHETLLGKRIYTSPYVPELGAGNKTVIFGNLNYYWIGDRQGITFKRLNERYADTGQIGFLATKRLDGKLILPEAVKVLQQADA